MSESLGVSGIGSCELSNVGVENETQVLYRSNVCS